MQSKSFIEFAYDAMSTSSTPLTFKDLFDKTLELSGLELSSADLKTKMSKLFTSLSIDERFVLVDGCWDLSSRHTFSQIHKADEEYDDEEDEADEEEKELLRQELGEEQEEDSEHESDDLDFDKPQVNPEDDDQDF